MAKQDVQLELTLVRKYNYGNFNGKEVTIKVSGTDEQIEEQFESKKEKLLKYISEIEEIVELAHEANILKKKVAATGAKAE